MKNLQKEIHRLAKHKGWWDAPIRNKAEQFANFHAEISEAWEEFRNGHAMDEIYFNPENPKKPEGVPVELADAVIRIMDTCDAYGIDLEAVIKLKHEYNKTRPYRHGNKMA